MILFFSADGSPLSALPERVFQGSNKANTVYFISPISHTCAVNVGFELPNGTTTTLHLMTPELDHGLVGVLDKNGVGYSVWKYDMPTVVTAQSGRVTVQFYVTMPNGVVLTTAKSIFQVEKGVAPAEIDEPNAYQEILNRLTAINNDVYNVETTLSTIPETYLTKEDGATKLELDKKYTKEEVGIPKTDLEASVQNSLSNADTALTIAKSKAKAIVFENTVLMREYFSTRRPIGTHNVGDMVFIKDQASVHYWISDRDISYSIGNELYIVSVFEKQVVDLSNCVKSEQLEQALASKQNASVTKIVDFAGEVDLQDNTEYTGNVTTSCNFNFPEGNFECWLRLTLASDQGITVTFPESAKFLTEEVEFTIGSCYEISIKDGYVVSAKVAE